MPYNVANGDVIQAVIESTLQGQKILNVTHWRITALGVPTDGVAVLLDLASAMDIAGGWIEKYAGVLSDDVVIDFGHFQHVWPIRYTKIQTALTPANGTVAGNSLPANVAWALTRRSNFAVPGAVGTSHIAGVDTTWVTGGSLNATGAVFRNAFRDVQNDVLVGALCRFTPILFKVSNPAGSLVVDDATIQTTMRTMHRRTVGLGI